MMDLQFLEQEYNSDEIFYQRTVHSIDSQNVRLFLDIKLEYVDNDNGFLCREKYFRAKTLAHTHTHSAFFSR